MTLRISKTISLLAFLVMLVGVKSNAQQHNGMYFDTDHSFLMPLMDDNYLVGHASVNQLDRISKDSNSFALNVMDDKLNNLGQKKFNLHKNFELGSIVFNGKEIITQFLSTKDEVRYLIYNQEAKLTFDTTFVLPIVKSKKYSFQHLQPTPILPVKGRGVLHNVSIKRNDKIGFATIYVSDNHDIRVKEYMNEGEGASIKIVGANDNTVLKAIYKPKKNDNKHDYDTELIITSITGDLEIGRLNISKGANFQIFPIAAEFKQGNIEVISSFVKRQGKYGKIKFGLCVHNISPNGKLIKEKFNELTESLKTDSATKKNKLLIYSYLYFHLGKKLNNGNWLLAMEHFQRANIKVRMIGNTNVTYNKANIGLVEVDSDAEVVDMFIEKCRKSGRSVPKVFARNPHLGTLYVRDKMGMDISYFIENKETLNEEISYVYLNYNSKNNKKTVGNIMYKNGLMSSDKFVIPKSQYSYTAIFPTRFRHCLLIKINPSIGLFDFDNIKFNN